MGILKCPSQVRSGVGYSDYAGVHHSSEAPIDVTNNGVFFLNSRLGYEDLKDGSSHTMFIGEKVTVIGDLGWMSGTRATLRNVGALIGGGGGFGPLRAPGPSLTPKHPPAGVAEPGFPADSALAPALLLDTLLGPRDFLPSQYGPAGGTLRSVKRPSDVRLAVGGFGSLHPGGAQFAFGDGSCRFISVSATTIGQFAHRHDGVMQVDEAW
jgi:prepilin-type processing-associated H-X9-DG protein